MEDTGRRKKTYLSGESLGLVAEPALADVAETLPVRLPRALVALHRPCCKAQGRLSRLDLRRFGLPIAQKSDVFSVQLPAIENSTKIKYTAAHHSTLIQGSHPNPSLFTLINGIQRDAYSCTCTCNKFISLIEKLSELSSFTARYNYYTYYPIPNQCIIHLID